MIQLLYRLVTIVLVAFPAFDEHALTKARYTILDTVNDSESEVLLELGRLSVADGDAYQLRLIRASLIAPGTREYGIPIIYLVSPQRDLAKIEYDGNCYYVSAQFDPRKDRITSSYFKSRKGRDMCFYVITPDGFKIGFSETPKNVGEALKMHIFDRDVLDVIAERELLELSANEALRRLATYGFGKIGNSAKESEIKLSWFESKESPLPNYSMWIGIRLRLTDGVVRDVEVEPVLTAI